MVIYNASTVGTLFKTVVETEMDKNELTEMLRPHVIDLHRDAAKGNRCARHIIDLYEMHRSCPNDPCAFALCVAALAAWRMGGE